MQHLGMSRISHAQEDPGRRTVPRIDLSPTSRSETVLPMLQRRPGGFDNNEVLEVYPSLFKPSNHQTDSMLLGSSPVFLLRSPVFLRGTEQLAFSLLVITSGATGNSGERSRSQMRVGFVRLNDGPDIKLFILVGLGRSFFVCCLAHRGSTVGFLLLQCSSGVVRHPRDLQVSVATHFCRVLIFVSS